MPEKAELDIYSERAHLLAVMVALFGGVLSYTDPMLPDWPVLYVESPAGQLSWHIHPDDQWIFPGVPVVEAYPWDGHSTERKYIRILALAQRLPKMTYANPEYGQS